MKASGMADLAVEIQSSLLGEREENATHGGWCHVLEWFPVLSYPYSMREEKILDGLNERVTSTN
jgi:hypothetical protein